MSIRAIVFVLMMFGGVAQADERRALAEQYVALPTVQKMMDDMLSPEAMKGQFLAMLPANATLSETQVGEIVAVLAAEMALLRPKMETSMIDGAAAQFSEAELKALMAFYQTPEGASVMAKTQPYMQQVMTTLGPEMFAMQQRIKPEIIRIIQAKK